MIFPQCKWYFDINWQKFEKSWADVFQIYPNAIHLNPLQFCDLLSINAPSIVLNRYFHVLFNSMTIWSVLKLPKIAWPSFVRERELGLRVSHMMELPRCRYIDILVPRGRAPFGQHQESRPLAKSNTGSPRFTDFPSLCACSVSSLTNLIGSDLNLLCLQSHSKTECRWTRPEVAILGADQKERGLWGREWYIDWKSWILLSIARS